MNPQSLASNAKLKKQLSLIGKSWPKPGEFIFYIEDDHVWIHKVRLPQGSRGSGTLRLSRILSICDKFNAPVCLHADPIPVDDYSKNQNQPGTFHLVKWYSRFDFTPHGPDENGFFMHRSPQGLSMEKIIDRYHQNKKNDISIAQFIKKWGEPDQEEFTPAPFQI